MNVMGDNDTIPASIFPHTYIIGRCGVGKTTLLWRYLYNEFKDLKGTIVDKENKKLVSMGGALSLNFGTQSVSYPIARVILFMLFRTRNL